MTPKGKQPRKKKSEPSNESDFQKKIRERAEEILKQAQQKSKNCPNCKSDGQCQLEEFQNCSPVVRAMFCSYFERNNDCFTPMAGAHPNNCKTCTNKNVCILSDDNYTFCPKQTIESSKLRRESGVVADMKTRELLFIVSRC